MKLGRIFGSKKAEVKGEWRKRQAYKHHNLYYLQNIIRMIKLVMRKLSGACDTRGRDKYKHFIHGIGGGERREWFIKK
jgi:hypothetical protein